MLEKGVKNHDKMTPKWFENRSQDAPKWVENRFKNLSKNKVGKWRVPGGPGDSNREHPSEPKARVGGI